MFFVIQNQYTGRAYVSDRLSDVVAVVNECIEKRQQQLGLRSDAWRVKPISRASAYRCLNSAKKVHGEWIVRSVTLAELVGCVTKTTDIGTTMDVA